MSEVNTEVIRLNDIGQRIRAERERIGLSQTELGAKGGVQKNAQHNYEAGKRAPDATYLAGVSRAGCDIAYILTGERSMANLPPDMIKSMQQTLADPSEFAPIPVYGAELAAGHGIENGAEEIIGHMAFRRDWLRKIGVSSASVLIARTKGDSMAPTLHNGDVVLIDTSQREVPLRSPLEADIRHRAPIFALRSNDGALIKRLLRPAEDQMMIISDNPDYLPRIMKLTKGAESIIIGRVLWWGHTVREQVFGDL